MIIALTALTLAVVVLTVLVAGLLRSHAVILRTLHELGSGIEPSANPDADASAATASGRSTVEAERDLGLPRPPAVTEGRAAHDVVGTGPRGEAHAVRVVGAQHDTVLAFLSSGCTTCHAFWEELHDHEDDDARVVVVTKGEEHESPAAIADVAPRDVTVIMSTAAWQAYEVPGSPYVVHVDGPSGRVVGEGTGPTWAQVRRMLRNGAADLEARRQGSRKAYADGMREQDVDHLLLAAGIEPGDPSLYTRADGTAAEVDAAGGAASGAASSQEQAR